MVKQSYPFLSIVVSDAHAILSAMDTTRNAAARGMAEAVARRSYRRLVALLVARTRDVAGAEDALSAAFAAALVDWPEQGVPDNPEAWLLTAARRRSIDALRRRRSLEQAAAQLRLLEEASAAAERPDQHSALAFVCCHPAIEPGVRAPLVLQTLLGFEAAEIAAAFGTSPAGMSQRLVRAKRRIRKAGPRFEAPARAELEARCEAVRTAIGAVMRKG
jgi:RNA polymerase sigma-70 factor (ECF subfamily)